jgi:DNA mismatch endonuclease, patch repair protein
MARSAVEQGYCRRTRLRETLVVSEATRKTMRGNRHRDTVPETTLRKALWRAGLRGYRVNVRSLPGSPDVVFTRAKLAVFVHGCFWHGCPNCDNYRLPKTNSAFWAAKLQENQTRDARAQAALREAGYSILVLWECQIERQLDATVALVRSHLQSSSAQTDPV